MDFQFLFDWLLSGAINFANSVIDVITTILPTSPFDYYLALSVNIPILNLLNYFVPIGTYVTIVLTWAQALALFYGQAIIARWIKVTKG